MANGDLKPLLRSINDTLPVAANDSGLKTQRHYK